MTDYQKFITSKAVRAKSLGISDDADMPQAMKPFQASLTRWALRRGKAAIFAGTGLGKTLMQLAWADVVERSIGRRVLIVAPLAVAQQTVSEAEKFGIDNVDYAPDGSSVATRIVVTNYDRIDKFDMSEFGAIVLDESSIIKSETSKTRASLIDSCRGINYKLCCTATPAPNDWIELGNHSEFLDVLTNKEMLATYFVHDGSIRAGTSGSSGGWRLKGHSQGDFWRWVASWAAMVRHPSDLGVSEPGYDLPSLHRHQVTVAAEYAPIAGALFPMQASTLSERLNVRRSTISDRVKVAADIVNKAPGRPWLVWCNLNDESTALTKAIDGAIEVRGSHDRDVKAERLIGFANGDIRILVSKPSIAGFGMNFQICSDMVFVGLNDSFEQLYQAVRRCWRFGQERPVNAFMVASELEGAVVANLKRKESDYEAMIDAMSVHMLHLTKDAVGGAEVHIKQDLPQQKMEVPEWMGMSA